MRQPIVTITNGVLLGRGTLLCAPPPMARFLYEASAVAAIAPPPVSGPPATRGPAAPRDRAEARARPPAGHVPAIFVTVGTEVKKEPAGPEPARQEIPHPGAGSAADIALAHRKPKAVRPDFVTDRERGAFCVESEIDALLPLLPEPIVLHMLSGELGLRQVPDPAARCAQVRRILANRAGAEGDRIAGVRLMLARVREYAAVHFPDLAPETRDNVCFPMSAALAHEIIHARHAAATARAVGAKKGTTVGNCLRADMLFAAEHLKWPLDVTAKADKEVVAGAAPPPQAGGGAVKAGTLPIAVRCHLEAIANGASTTTLREHGLADGAIQVTAFYARSLLVAGLDHSVRVAEGARVELTVDSAEPYGVSRGVAYLGGHTKERVPLEVFAPAEGILGPYEWFPNHLTDVLARGHAFPAWTKPRGSKGEIAKAAGLIAGKVAAKADMCRALSGLLQLPPLAYSEAEVKEWGFSGHVFHATPPEWARSISVNPRLAEVALPPALAAGFTEQEVDALGHWLRDKGAKAEASAAQAAVDAVPDEARRAAAVASLPGKPSQRGRMRVYYGAPGAAAGGADRRYSERDMQLRVRQRLIHTVREVLRQRGWLGDWTAMPRGPLDLAAIRTRS